MRGLPDGFVWPRPKSQFVIFWSYGRLYRADGGRCALQTLLVSVGCGGVLGLLHGVMADTQGSTRQGSAPLG